MQKKILSLVLVLCLMCSFLPRMALAASAGIYGPECGENATWTLDEETGTLRISGTGKMYGYVNTVEQICAPWFPQRDKIRHVIIEDGITSIGTHAFAGCYNLATVVIGKDVQTIDPYAFYECISLADVQFGPAVSAINNCAFACCESLTKIEIPGGTIGSFAFGWCYALKEVDLSPEVEAIEDGAFTCCTGLDTFFFPASITHIGNKILSDNELKEVRMDEANPYYTIDEAGVLYSKDKTILYDCYINLSGEYSVPEGVTEIYDDAFNGKANLTAILLPESLKIIGRGAFNRCSGLTKMDIPSGVTKIGDLAFLNCSGISEITIPIGVSRVSNDIVDGCTALKKINVAEGHSFYFSDEQGILYYTRKDTGTGEVYRCPEGFEGSCVIPSSVTHVDDYAFYSCAGLTEIAFHHYSITLGSDSFAHCANLKKITFYSQGVYFEDPFFVFEGCDSLQEIYFYGEPPTSCGLYTFPKSATLYYPEGTEGWSTPTWNGYPAFPFRPFQDVAPGTYYFSPVLWAVNEGITNGTGNGNFSPDRDCTRGQIVTFLWRAAGCPEPTITENPFADVAPAAYYYKAVLWAVENGITTGTSANKFSPDASCTRGQVVTFLWRAEGKPAPKTQGISFTDVAPDAYYRDAVIWALEEGITTGTTIETFSPDAICTRGQIATFLYRTYN